MDMLFIRGRLVAQTFDEAMKILRDRIESMGYHLKPGRIVKPSPVQPWEDETWWDYNVEVQKIV